MPSASVCPSESDFAQLAAGMLHDDARRALEEHLDQCQACTELMGILGSLPRDSSQQVTLASSDGMSSSQRNLPWWLTDRAAVASTLLATQCFWSGVLWLPAMERLLGDEQATMPTLLWAFAAYSACIGMCGPLLGVAALVAVGRRSPWALRFIVAHAVAIMPSLVMAPLGVVALIEMRRQAHPRVHCEK